MATESKQSDATLADFGMIGMAVMGKNLALNLADQQIRVAVWDREEDAREDAVKESQGKLRALPTPAALVAAIERPRKIMMMIKAGNPVDLVLDQLLPLLDPDDIVIDGGNSWFEDTRRREASCRKANIHFIGIGVSGGEEGARHGPSLMPGGSSEAYTALAPILESISAKTDSGPCVTHIGPDGAGHFVKMVHNGIEYADMQVIAEAYHLLREGLGLEAPDLADVFSKWNQGPLESFLIEITAQIFRMPDALSKGWLIDRVLDKAGQKGTGRWTGQIALELGVAIPSIAAAIDSRTLSSMKDLRTRASQALSGPQVISSFLVGAEREGFVHRVHQALFAAKICAYAQGLALIQNASTTYNWNIDLQEVVRIWKGGCIIRAQFLDTIRQAFERNPKIETLLLDETIVAMMNELELPWRQVVSLAQRQGLPVPGMSAGLGYYDSLRTLLLPQNLTQAQRDAFGAHTYQRSDENDGPFVHSEWLEQPGASA